MKETVKREASAQQAKTTEEQEAEEEEDLHAERHVKGELVVFVRQGSERRKLLSEPVEGSYTPMMAGRHEAKLARVGLSPSGKTVVFLSQTSSGNMRDSSLSMRVLGVLRWGGVPLVLR